MLEYLVSCLVSAAPPCTDGMSLYILVKSSKYGNNVTLLGEDKAEPIAVVPVVSAIAKANRRAAVSSEIAPTATAQEAVQFRFLRAIITDG